MKSFLIGVLVATVISGGVTYAVASGSTDRVAACAHKKTGALRLSNGKKCKKSERLVSWPAGLAQAAQGATGPKGDTGATGPSGSGVGQAYTSSFELGLLEPSVPYANMGGITLPAGTYIITANIQMSEFIAPDAAVAAVPGTPDATCRFKYVNDDIPALGSLGSRSTTWRDVMVFQTHVSLTSETFVPIECKNDSLDYVGFRGTFYAIPVSNVTYHIPFDYCPESMGRGVMTAVC